MTLAIATLSWLDARPILANLPADWMLQFAAPRSEPLLADVDGRMKRIEDHDAKLAAEWGVDVEVLLCAYYDTWPE